MTDHGIERYLTPVWQQKDPMLTPAEVAEWLRIAPSTLSDWRVDRKGPKTQPVGRRIFYRASDVQAWLDAQRESA